MNRSNCLLLLVAFVFSCAVGGCGSSSETGPPQAVALSQSDSGRTVYLLQDQIMTASLPGNPSTGYTWEVSPSADSVLAQQGNPEYVPDSNAIGSGGTYRFTFKAISPGTAPLNLVYRRPLETGAAPVQTFWVTVTVDG